MVYECCRVAKNICFCTNVVNAIIVIGSKFLQYKTVFNLIMINDYYLIEAIGNDPKPEIVNTYKNSDE